MSIPDTRNYVTYWDIAFSVMNGKWKSLIITLIHHGINRPGALQKKLPGITRKVLTRDLKELESHRIVKKKVFAELPLRVEYSLTPHGRTILPVLESLARWGMGHIKVLRSKNIVVVRKRLSDISTTHRKSLRTLKNM